MFMKLLDTYDKDSFYRIQAIFASIFVLQNRMQTAGEKIQKQVTMKQWLLLAMIQSCPEPRTLTNLGELMGCSRQNIKKIAVSLEKIGFVRFENGKGNALLVTSTDAIQKYAVEMVESHSKTLELLFSEFNDDEITELFRLYKKLFIGIDKIEAYAEEIK